MTRMIALGALFSLALSAPAFAGDGDHGHEHGHEHKDEHAEGPRQLGAHEHGVGRLSIAVEGGEMAMEFEAPGADIFGSAAAANDPAIAEPAVKALEDPLALFTPPAAAECTLKSAKVEVVALDEDHDDHDHDEHGHDDHKEHGHDDHKEHEHGHDEHGHDEHGDEEHADDGGHTDVRGVYAIACAKPEALTGLDISYFERFTAGEELEVTIVTESYQGEVEATKDVKTIKFGAGS